MTITKGFKITLLSIIALTVELFIYHMIMAASIAPTFGGIVARTAVAMVTSTPATMVAIVSLIVLIGSTILLGISAPTIASIQALKQKEI